VTDVLIGQGSLEFSRDRSNRSDIESGHGPGNSGDLGLSGFFKKVKLLYPSATLLNQCYICV